MAYKPNTKNSSRSIPYMAMVAQVDPDHERAKHYAPEYPFSRRVFMADPDKRGAFNSNSNTYPVGQQSGAADPAYAQRPFYRQVTE